MSLDQLAQGVSIAVKLADEIDERLVRKAVQVHAVPKISNPKMSLQNTRHSKAMDRESWTFPNATLSTPSHAPHTLHHAPCSVHSEILGIGRRRPQQFTP